MQDAPKGPTDGDASSTAAEPAERSSAEKTLRNQRRRGGWFGRIAGLIAKVLLVFLLVFGALAWFAYQSAQQQPDFYKAALQIPAESLKREGDQFETKIVELQNSFQSTGQWQVVFTGSQINGWLSSDLPEKFPELMPPEVADPRIDIVPGEIRVAFRLETEMLSGIVVIKGDVFSTNDNEIGIQIKSIQSGVVPIPLSQWADEITEGLHSSGIPMTWSEIDGDPVAIIPLPAHELVQDNQQIVVSAIQTQEDQIVLTGSTSPDDGINGSKPLESMSETVDEAIDRIINR